MESQKTVEEPLVYLSQSETNQHPKQWKYGTTSRPVPKGSESYAISWQTDFDRSGFLGYTICLVVRALDKRDI